MAGHAYFAQVRPMMPNGKGSMRPTPSIHRRDIRFKNVFTWYSVRTKRIIHRNSSRNLQFQRAGSIPNPQELF
ncbi:hypothetical protein JTE90_028070 [Oedothorax gibbosus]|uniref:Uncharacterized protein n=1 Tax=Oedothorax gibbosus TaxID=931172 RepID=A0AAV6VB86_9ARAC|nr:hypothetical protein JTE90_028070 [Oedothorax gibbosus]